MHRNAFGVDEKCFNEKGKIELFSFPQWVAATRGVLMFLMIRWLILKGIMRRHVVWWQARFYSGIECCNRWCRCRFKPKNCWSVVCPIRRFDRTPMIATTRFSQTAWLCSTKQAQAKPRAPKHIFPGPNRSDNEFDSREVQKVNTKRLSMHVINSFPGLTISV